jgi:transposase
MLRMDKVYVIRHKALVEGGSIRSVARELGISRNTVAKYLRVSEPVRKEAGPRPRPVMDRVAPRIDELLKEWAHRVTPKQRVTGSRILRQLRDEHYQVGITTVRDYLRERRRQAAEVYVPLVYRPGDVGQFDFFEVTVEEKGELRRAWKLLLHLPYSDTLSVTSSHSTTRVTSYPSWTATCGLRSTSAVCRGGLSTTTSRRRYGAG